MSSENVLGIPVIRVNKPCEECGKPGVNLQYSLVGITGVLCQSCLEAVIEQVNTALNATNKQEKKRNG